MQERKWLNIKSKKNSSQCTVHISFFSCQKYCPQGMIHAKVSLGLCLIFCDRGCDMNQQIQHLLSLPLRSLDFIFLCFFSSPVFLKISLFSYVIGRLKTEHHTDTVCSAPPPSLPPNTHTHFWNMSVLLKLKANKQRQQTIKCYQQTNKHTQRNSCD